MKELFKNMGPAAQLAIFILMIGLGLIIAAVIGVLFMVSGPEQNNMLLWVQGISQIVMFLCPALLFAWLFHSGTGSFFQTGMRRWQIAPALLAILIIIIAIPLVDFLTSWNESLHLPEKLGHWEESMRQKQALSQDLMNGFLSRPGFGNMLINLLVLAAIPAVCEEFVFRGVVQKTLVAWFRNPHAAIITTAAVFSLTHFEMFYFVPRFVLGIVLGYIFYYSQTIWASALAHFTNNAIIVILTYAHNAGTLGIDPQNLHLPYAGAFAIGSLILTALLMLFVIKICTKNTENQKKIPFSENDENNTTTN